MNVLMIPCPYCHVPQPARVTPVADVDLASDVVPDVVRVKHVADVTAAKTHAQTCRSRRTR